MILGAGIILILWCLVSVFRRWKNREVPLLIDELEGHDFEYYCADLLRNGGYQNVRVTRASGDFGVDILAERDGITYGIQCKRYDRRLFRVIVYVAANLREELAVNIRLFIALRIGHSEFVYLTEKHLREALVDISELFPELFRYRRHTHAFKLGIAFLFSGFSLRD